MQRLPQLNFQEIEVMVIVVFSSSNVNILKKTNIWDSLHITKIIHCVNLQFMFQAIGQMHY